MTDKEKIEELGEGIKERLDDVKKSYDEISETIETKVTEAVQTYWTCSIEKSQKLLGYQETLSLEDGMRNTYEWYKEHNWLK